MPRQDNGAGGSELEPRVSPRGNKASKLDTDHSLAVKQRMAYTSATSQASLILTQIGTIPSWKQFEGASVLMLKEALANCTAELGKSQLYSQIVIDQISMKKRMEAKEYDKACRSFVTDMQGPIDKLSRMAKKIMAQHEVGLKADQS